jgi:signal transduction histidine kinase
VGTGSERVNILLVDDQPSRLVSYETILRSLGQNLVTASSGLEALQRVMQDDFAVILLDVSMPGMDGFETASLIHKHPRFEKTPIVFVTGVHFSDLDRIKGYQSGAIDYVQVPISPEILRSKISVLIELYCQRRELEVLNRSLADANSRLELSNTRLQEQRTMELESLNAALRRTNDELETANAALHAEVATRQSVEQALKDADRRKDEFLAMLAHELRNPLAPIANAVAILRRLSTDDPTIGWTRELLGRQTAQLARLVDDLLDVSRVTRGQITLARARVAVGAVVAQALETVQPLIDERSQRLTLDLPEEDLAVDGDLARLTQALGNLLHNAAKYTDPGGNITLSVRREAELIAIRVVDTGVGIEPSAMSNLFDLFFRSSGPDEHAHGGLGIGLALARRLVELHGGTLSAASAGLNCGSEFTMLLPAAPAVPATTDRGAVAAQAAADDGGRESSVHRILVVDDNRDTLDGMALLLSGEGYEVRTAADGTQAIAAAAEFRPDVALLDLGMPNGDGYEVARAIRKQSWGQMPYMIAVTGWGQLEDRRRTREAGFDHHIVKPADIDEILALLRSRPGRSSAPRDGQARHGSVLS